MLKESKTEETIVFYVTILGQVRCPLPLATPMIKSNLSLHSLYYAEACNEPAGPISPLLRLRATRLFKKKRRSGGEPLATLCSI